MKKRILSLLLVVAMLASMVVMPAYAVIGVDSEDYNNTPEICPCGCGKAWSEITDWVEFGGSMSVSGWSQSGKTHYRLKDHVTASSAVSRVFCANTGHGKMVFDLNGFNITHASTAAKDYFVFEIRSGAELHVVDTKGGSQVQSSATPLFVVKHNDTSKNAGGALTVYGGSYKLTRNTNNTDNGAMVRTYNAACGLNIKGGVFDASIYNQTGKDGGIIYTQCATTIDDGYFLGGTARNGGIIYAATTLNINGGYFVAGSATLGSAVYGYNIRMTIQNATIEGSVYNRGTNTTLAGRTVITELDLLSTNAGTQVSAIAGLTSGSSIAVKAAVGTPFTTAMNPETVATYASYFRSTDGKVVGTTEDYKLVVTDEVQKDTCPFCGSEEVWQDWTATAGGTVNTTGHYRLTNSKRISNYYNIADSSNICLDMNGFDITGASNSKQLFWVGNGSTLNICDLSDSGNSELKAYGNCAGGVAYLSSGNLNIKGGTNGISLSSVAPTPGDGSPDNPGGLLRLAQVENGPAPIVKIEDCTLIGSNYAHTDGGAVHIGGGTLYLTGCTVTGTAVSKNGGAISVGAGCRLYLDNTTVNNGTAATINGFSTSGIYFADSGHCEIKNSTVGDIYTKNNGLSITIKETVCIGNLILDNATQSTINMKINTESMNADSTIGVTVTSDKFGGYGKISTAGEDAAEKLACFEIKTDGVVKVARDRDILVEKVGVAAVDANGYKTWFATADEALALNPEYLLLGAISAVEVNTDAVIDINGNNTVISGEAEVTLFDSANTNELSFGEVTLEDVTLANPVEYTAPNGFRYCTVAGDNNTYSFHVLNLEVSAIGLKTSGNGMYYYANFAFDSALQNAVAYYGIEYSLYDKNGVDKIVDKTQAVAIDSNTLALETYKDIPIGAMNGIIGSDINGYSDSECGQMKIEAKPFIIIDGQVIYGEAVKYSMYDCCAAVDAMITELNAGTAAQKEEAAMYTGYMENLFNVVWAEYVLGWNFTNFNKDA